MLDNVLKTAFASDGTALVEILVDPDRMAAATKSPD